MVYFPEQGKPAFRLTEREAEGLLWKYYEIVYATNNPETLQPLAFEKTLKSAGINPAIITATRNLAQNDVAGGHKQTKESNFRIRLGNVSLFPAPEPTVRQTNQSLYETVARLDETQQNLVYAYYTAALDCNQQAYSSHVDPMHVRIGATDETDAHAAAYKAGVPVSVLDAVNNVVRGQRSSDAPLSQDMLFEKIIPAHLRPKLAMGNQSAAFLSRTESERFR